MTLTPPTNIELPGVPLIGSSAVLERPNFTRVWCMPNADTLGISEISAWTKKHLMRATVTIDPFARNCRMARWRNDLNPETAAEYHMDASDFLEMLKSKAVVADAAIFDPPYSPRQVKEVYESIGRHFGIDDQHNAGRWIKEKDSLNDLIRPEGVVLSYGWNTIGMGKERGYELFDVLCVCHGGAHNDTICIAERKRTDRQHALAL